MRKLLLLIIIAIGAISCEGPMGPPGEETAFEVRYVTVFENEWQLVGGKGGINSYYTATVRDNTISKWVYDNGAFMVHQIQNFDRPNEVQTALPFVLALEDDAGTGYQWTETISYDYNSGYITFYVNYSDFRTDVRRPGTCDFKITMMW